MAKIIQEFNIPEESEMAEIAINSWKYKSVVDYLFDVLNGQIKYKDLTEESVNVVEDIRQKIIEKMEDYGI